MTQPLVPQQSPYPVDVESGKTYYWCACGQSSKQPFCDGSHKDTAFTPVKFEATESRRLFFCGCKHSRNGALCDGSHNRL
ncbi:MAG: CDGSH iron-sulfur domain-containing protein [Gammaproteobacteria bacterium]|nr:CDGSH iron-sulfur domain-containing protein [Gammaproteobacteria bacterium]